MSAFDTPPLYTEKSFKDEYEDANAYFLFDTPLNWQPVELIGNTMVIG